MEKNQTTTLQKNSNDQRITGTLEVFKQDAIICSSHVSSLTSESVKKSSQLSLIKKELGNAKAGEMITKILNEVSLMTNTTMDAGVKTMCAKMIMSNYWHLKIDELLLVIRDGILGRFGKIYGNFCFTTLTEWIEKYQQEKLGGCESESLQYTSHEKIERPKSPVFDEKNYDLPPVSKHIEEINKFWKEAGNDI